MRRPIPLPVVVRGPRGEEGAEGEAATIRIGQTTTGATGSVAAVTNTGTKHAAILNFTIPRGTPGAAGATGPAGAPGAPGPAGPPGSGTATAPFDWPQVYADPANYTSRVLQPGYNSGIPIAAGAFPPGYRVANGTNGGGFPATGAVSDGTLPIRLQPPPSGVDRLKFVVNLKVTVVNSSPTMGSFSVILGTTASSGPSMPLYPYLGVAHDLFPLHPVNILQGTALQINTFRMDVVDIALLPGIPGWPNWTMLIDPTGSLLYPAVCPLFQNLGTVPLTVMDVFAFGFAC